MVALAYHHRSASYWCFNCDWRWQCYGTFYLYTILETMNISREKSLESIIVIAGALLFIHFRYDVVELTYISFGLIVISIISKFATGVIAWLWFKFAEGLGYVMSKVILTVVFFVFLYPVSLLKKLFSGTDELKLKRMDTDSYFTTRDHKYLKEDLDKVW